MRGKGYSGAVRLRFRRNTLVWTGGGLRQGFLLSQGVILIALTAMLLALTLVPRAQAVTLPTGFTEKVVFTGLSQPTAVRFSPDGRVLVAEKSGLIKEFDSLTDSTPRVYADLRPNVHDYWDRGLLGIALDPSFPTKNVIYALYTHDAPIGGTAPVYNDNCADPTGAGCKVSGRLSRVLADGSEQVMIEDWCQQYPSHSIGSLAFGPDGYLYVSGGDGASFNWVDFGQGGGALNRCSDPASEGGALRSQDLRTTSDPTTLDGALLRIDPDTGAGAPGNPFASSTDANARRIIAHGLRNPFRITFRPGTGELWAGDVGWNEWEEINRVVDVADTTAENFGWPCYEGSPRQPGYDAQNLPICETLYGQNNAVTAPYFAYRHSDHVIPSESCPIGGSSIAGLSFAFYSGGPYPAEYDGALFFADYTRKCIWAMEKGGTVLPSPSNIKGFVGGAANPVDLQVGPDGLLYYVDIGGGGIRRIEYTATVNQPPVAVAKANPMSGDVGMTVSFDGSSSSDPNGDSLSYAWDLDADGAFDDSTAVKPTRTYNAAGTFRVSLQVADGKGGTAIDAVTIGVGLPKVTIASPGTSLRWSVGETVSFAGSATDNQGQSIPPSKLEWTLVLKHGACPDCHDHFLQTYVGVTSGTFRTPDHDYPSELELALTATDASGLRNSTSVRVLPKTTTLNFQSSPTGLKLTFNGVNSVSPFSRTVIVGSNNSLSAPSPQTLRGKQLFRTWSDGVTTANRTIVAPANTATYTATFAKK